jgi:hypothetical protein
MGIIQRFDPSGISPRIKRYERTSLHRDQRGLGKIREFYIRQLGDHTQVGNPRPDDLAETRNLLPAA